MTLEVHWHEGMFLQPHHLQAMQRVRLGREASARRELFAYPYGMIEASLSRDALANKRVQFDALRAVMPGGTLVEYRASEFESADLPALDIEEAFAAGGGELNVLLATPLPEKGRPNAMDLGVSADPRSKRLYRVVETEEPDENTGENKKPMLMRRVNARLMLDTEDRTGLDVLPVLRVIRSVGEESGAPREDPQFVPPCLVLAGSPTMRAWVRDLGNQIEATRGELANSLSKGGFNADQLKGLAIQNLMKLGALNRAAVRVPTIAREAHAVSALEVYTSLREVLADLAALFPDKDPFEASAFSHDAPGPAVADVIEKVRQFLKVQQKGSYLMLNLTRGERLFEGEFTEEHLTKPNEYFLGIKSGADPRAIARLAEDPDSFKLMPKSLAEAAVRGVRLKEERHPPVQLPTPVGLHYFRLLRSESKRTWDRIGQEKRIAVKFPPADAGMLNEMSIYMTVPD